MKNLGKVFEEQFAKSVPSNMICYRLKDGTASWEKAKDTRFQHTNICDFIIFTTKRLIWAELKSTIGTSLPLSRILGEKNKKGVYKGLHKIDRLTDYSLIPNSYAGYFVEFRDVDKCFYMSVRQLITFMAYNERKSIPLEYFEQRCIEIPVKYSRVKKTYNIKKLLKEI